MCLSGLTWKSLSARHLWLRCPGQTCAADMSVNPAPLPVYNYSCWRAWLYWGTLLWIYHKAHLLHAAYFVEQELPAPMHKEPLTSTAKLDPLLPLQSHATSRHHTCTQSPGYTRECSLYISAAQQQPNLQTMSSSDQVSSHPLCEPPAVCTGPQGQAQRREGSPEACQVAQEHLCAGGRLRGIFGSHPRCRWASARWLALGCTHVLERGVS